MIDRVIENWLTKAGERTYEVPFCYMLSNQGYHVVHLTRHCAMELGKDVIAIDPDGVPCAFQLKGGNIKLSQWRTEIAPQVESLVTGTIVHPSIASGTSYRPYLVVNGYLDEEVQREIDDKNRKWETIGYERLQVIAMGTLLQWAKDLGPSLWPTELADVKALIDLHMSPGNDVFPKAELARLLESVLPFYQERGKDPSKARCTRAVASSALLTSICTAPFSAKENHVAEIEAWTLFAAHVLALRECWKLPKSTFAAEVNLAKGAIQSAMSRLCEELHGREFFFEGDGTVDTPFFGARYTWVISLLAVLWFWRRSEIHNGTPTDEPFDFDCEEFILRFCHDHRKDLHAWGEAAIPQILAFYWLWRVTDGTVQPTALLAELVTLLTNANAPQSNRPLPNPYYEGKHVLSWIVDQELAALIDNHQSVGEVGIDDSFSGSSYYLEGLVHLFTRKNFKQKARELWPRISEVAVSTFVPENKWQLLMWRNKSSGRIDTVMPTPTMSWSVLRQRANESRGDGLPHGIVEDPVFALLFLIVYPHRGSAEMLRWLDRSLTETDWRAG